MDHWFRIIIPALALLAFGALLAIETQGFQPANPGAPTNVVNFVKEVFFRTNSIGSLVTGGKCNADDAATDLVSDYLPHPPTGPFGSIREALNALSQKDPRVVWSRKANGILRVRDGEVPRDVLNLRLRRVHFRDRVIGQMAIQDILSTPEVQAYLRKNGISQGMVTRVGDLGIMPGSKKGLPVLSDTLKGATVEEALDRVARFFHTLWIYSDCRKGSSRTIVVTT
jgi:hypothetical protein